MQNLEGLPLFTQEEWQSYYPADEYKNFQKKLINSERVQSCAIHFLLALHKNEEPIVKYIESQKISNFNLLMQRDDQCFGFTPLHIAVMKSMVKVLSTLLAAFKEHPDFKKYINAQDVFKWTPLHHAPSNHIFSILLQAGASQTLKTDLGATAEDLQLMMGRRFAQISLSKLTFIDLSGKVHRSVDQIMAAFKEQMGLQYYSDRPIYAPKHWKLLWNSTEGRKSDWIDCGALNPGASESLRNWNRLPPALLVAPCAELKGKIPLAYEVRTAEMVLKGKTIGPYGGLVDQKLIRRINFLQGFYPPWSTDHYTLSMIKADLMGNVTRWINAGFPNCVIFGYFYEGQTQASFITVDDCPVNTPLLFDYGPSIYHLTWGKQVILGREKMRAFFRLDLESLKKEYDKKLDAPTFLDSLRHVELYEKLYFPLNNPAAMLDLIYSHITPVSYWSAQANDLSSDWAKNHPPQQARMLHFLDQIESFEAVATKSPLKASIDQWIVDSVGELSVMQILEGLKRIAIALKANSILPDQWNEYKQKLSRELQEYDWRTDPQASMGIHSKQKFLLKEYLQLDPSDRLPSIISQMKALKEQGYSENDEEIQLLQWLWLQFSKTSPLRSQEITEGT